MPFLKANGWHLFHQDIPQLDSHSPKTECEIMFAQVFDEELFIWWHSICNTLIDLPSSDDLSVAIEHRCCFLVSEKQYSLVY